MGIKKVTHLDQIKIIADRLFKTRDGQALMKFLSDRYYDNKITDGDLSRQIGQRDVVWTLKRLAETNDDRRK